jgi:hypothetical protein
MGWGIEMLWSRASLDGKLRLGIIDAITIEHLQAPGRDYDVELALAEEQRFLEQAGIRSYEAVHINLDRWRRFRRAPDWSVR